MKKTASFALVPLLLGGFLMTGGCEMPDPPQELGVEGEVEGPPAGDERAGEALTRAIADISPVPDADRDIRGQVSFHAVPQGTAVTARIAGLEPGGVHGFHVHEGTDCADPGDHLSPRGHPHGGPTDPRDQRHKGDMGNLEADDEGLAEYEETLSNVSLDDSPGFVGHVVVIHEEADDLESQPSGDAGDPVACGVIRLAGG